MSTPVIDFHIHTVFYEQQNESYIDFVTKVLGEERWGFLFNRYQDSGLFCEFLQECGIDYGVILAELTPAVTGICTNEHILEFCRGRSNLIPFASINPALTSNMGAEMERLYGLGFRGLKLYPTYQFFYPNDNALYPLYSTVEKLQIPVMFHTGSSVFRGTRLKYGDPLLFDDLAVDFPGMNILLVHGGRGFWYDSAFFLSRLHKNVYLEIAGLPPDKLLTYFPEMDKIPDKIIFGSDWPGVSDLKKNVETIKRLPLPEDTKEKILGGNAARLLRI